MAALIPGMPFDVRHDGFHWCDDCGEAVNAGQQMFALAGRVRCERCEAARICQDWRFEIVLWIARRIMPFFSARVAAVLEQHARKATTQPQEPNP